MKMKLGKNKKLKEKKHLTPEEVEFKTETLKKEASSDEDFKKIIAFLVFVLIIGLCIGGLYFFNAKYVTKDSFQEESTTTTTEVSYNKNLINVSDIFGMDSKKDYNVLLYDKKDKMQEEFYKSVAARTYGDTPLYTVDLSLASNKAYYDPNGEENTKPTKVEEIKITRPTLIKFKKGKVVGYYTSQEDILKETKIK
jgi:hypothetical protein